MPKISALHLYPIKGCAGVSVPSFTLDRLGPIGDRRCMIVDRTGRFMSQRATPRMALIRVALLAHGLTLDAPDMPTLSLDFTQDVATPREVSVWRDTLPALSIGATARQWLSDFLRVDAELVRFDEHVARIANPEYAPADTHVGFADAYPMLLISQASLAHLNQRLSTALPMNRFRPNIVVSDTEPHAEDGWASIDVAGVTIDIVKPCDRCTVTTIDQATAVGGQEPLKTLARYRRRDNKIYFGQNLVHRAQGTLRVGDGVKVLSTRPPMVFE